MSDEIFHEINEDIRQQELEKFWKENRNWIAGGIVAAIVFTGSLSWWREHEFKSNVTATGAMASAIETNDPEKMGAFAGGADKNHALLAKFAEARLYVERKDNVKAAAVYDEVAAMSRVDKTWRDLAKLYSVNARLDGGEPAKLHEELTDLSGRKSAWRFSAMEMDALLYAREKKLDKAHDILAKLADDAEAPQDIRTRASTLRDLYAGDKGGQG